MADLAVLAAQRRLAVPAIKILFALCGASLALTAALAVTCFVKVYAMSFLGIKRGEWKLRGREKSTRPQFALAYLAIACFLLGILPTYVIPVLNRAVGPLVGASATASLVPPFFTATPENQQLPPAFLRRLPQYRRSDRSEDLSPAGAWLSWCAARSRIPSFLRCRHPTVS